MPIWAWMVGYVAVGMVTARVMFVLNEDENDDPKFAAAMSGAGWPVFLALLAIGATFWGLGQVLFAPSRRKRRELARKKAAQAEAERLRQVGIAERILSEEPVTELDLTAALDVVRKQVGR